MRFISCHDGKLLVLGAEAAGFHAAGGFATGLEALDALAPGRAFARGAVHEILGAAGHGTPLFFAALLAAASGEGQNRKFIAWCDPDRQMYPPALANHGIALTRLFLIRPRGRGDLLWSVSEALRCKGVAAVVAAMPRLSRIAARRLQLSAERGGGIGLLLRRAGSPGIDCYAAATRWLVRPAPGERTVQRWSVQLLHGHGGCVGQTIILELCRENHSVRAFESLAHRSLETRPGQTPTAAQAS